MSEPQLDYGDSVTIVITRVSFAGDPSHWEYDVKIGGGFEAGGTGPSFASAIDGACEYLWDEKAEWVQFDANTPRK